jgi:RNA polymerase sigma-70 factor, ECF subfamily
VTAAGDRALAERLVRERDGAAFGELYRRHGAFLHALAVRLLDDAAEAEDVVHDVWVRAVEGLPRFEWRSSLRTWLAGILLRRVREVARGAARDRPLDDGSPWPGPAPPDAATRVDLERAIRALAPGYRQVLLLHDVEGFTHEEIGDLLGIDAGTSKSQLSRARLQVRRALEPDDSGRRRG